MNHKITKEQLDFLGDDDCPQAVINRCTELLKANGIHAQTAWVNQETSTPLRYCLQMSTEDGCRRGYGETEEEAAIDLFFRLWLEFITVPQAPSPSDEEIALKRSGRPIEALKAYRERTGASLLIARYRLET